MIDKLEWAIGVLYAIAAIAGGMGGCATALHTFKHGKHAAFTFICAYTILGLVFGVVTLSVMFVTGNAPHTVHQLILYSLLGGSLGAVALSSSNWAIKAILRKFGLEVQVTLRRADEDRRENQE